MAVYLFKKVLSHNTPVIITLVLIIHSTQGINLGLISGDTKRHCGPVVIKKYSHKSPVVINIHSIPLVSPLTVPKIPSKPPPLKLSEPIRSLLPMGKPLFPWPGPMLPLIPKLPFIPTLPIIPSILPAPLIVPPLLPRRTLPLLPSFLPIVAPLPHISIPFLPKPSHTPMKPLKIPIIGKKSLLQKALDSEIRKVTLPYTMVKRQEKILDKLLPLKKTGSVTKTKLLNLEKLLL